jgi:hypothetical protein
MSTTPPSDSDPNTPAELARLREENKARRLSEAAAIAERDQLKKSLMTAEERKEAELADLKTQSQQWEAQRAQLLIDRAVLLQAPKVGIDLELALQLIKPASVKMKDGAVDDESVKKALEALLTQYPQLAVKPADAPAPSKVPAPHVPSTNPPASSVGAPVNDTLKDLSRYNLADAYKQTKRQ